MRALTLYKEIRPVEDAITLLREHGYFVNDIAFQQGGDCIYVEDAHVKFTFYPLNGQLSGDHVSGVSFDHMSSHLDDHAWYMAIFNSLHTN